MAKKLNYRATEIIFLFSVALLVLTSCDRNIPRVNLNGKNIICFGDSITEGVGANTGEDFPSLLAQKLNQPIINAGKGGDTTIDALRRLQGDVFEKNPGLVIVEFGANDYFQKIPPEETFKNLEDIVFQIQQHGATVVLAEVKIGIFFDEYYSGFKKISKRRKVLLIPDIMRGVFNNPKLKSDNLHPNAEGYKIISERIYKYISPLLR